jgi:acyl-CoA reductase-like NAD-dependent aldehyde dehydrogenase
LKASAQTLRDLVAIFLYLPLWKLFALYSPKLLACITSSCGATRPESWRRAQLLAVKALFTENHDELCDALWKDLRRNVIDADLMDVAYCGKEADYALKHLEIESVEAVIQWVNERPGPLGLVFAEDLDVVERILNATSSGDAEVNDCAIHPLFSELPFGGVGNSGMGKYHGRWGFESFTNARGVLYHSAKLDPSVRYPPYSKHTLERRITSKLTP